MIKNIKIFFAFLSLVARQRELIAAMARREVKRKYVGSILGFIWTFIHPLIMISIFYLVFSIGLKTRPMGDVPFMAWLAAGLAAWFVFVDIVNGSANIVIVNSNLVKKSLFHSEVLPIIQILSCLITHLVFLLVLLGFIVFLKMPFSFYFFQFLYYGFCMCVLAIGFSWFFSALNVFIRDVAQVVGVMLQLGFWATPIFWDLSIMPLKIQTVLKLNPMFYIVQGYRDSFIYFIPFWDRFYLTIYFWSVTIIIFICGAMLFQKLKPHFADAL